MQRRLIDGLLALVDAVRRLQSAPPTPGIEALLIQRGDEPLQARVMARVIHICGERWARERAEIEKPLAGVLRRLCQRSHAEPLTVSRWARVLQRWLDRGDADPFIRSWLDEAGSPLSTRDLREITALAVNRDERACQRLVEIAEALAPNLPDPRGRRVSVGTGVHLFLILHFGSSGHRPAYSWSDEKGDFVDPLTDATRLFCAILISIRGPPTGYPGHLQFLVGLSSSPLQTSRGPTLAMAAEWQTNLARTRSSRAPCDRRSKGYICAPVSFCFCFCSRSANALVFIGDSSVVIPYSR
jgi:hypothetical protein